MEENSGELPPQIDNRELILKVAQKLNEDMYNYGDIKVTSEEGEKLEEVTLVMENENEIITLDANDTALYVSVQKSEDEIIQYLINIQGTQIMEEKSTSESSDGNKERFRNLTPAEEYDFYTKLGLAHPDYELTQEMRAPSHLENEGAIYFRANEKPALPFPLPLPKAS